MITEKQNTTGMKTEGLLLIVLAALSAICAAACPVDGGTPEKKGSTAVRFASSGDALVQSSSGPQRIAGQNWQDGDAIGVYMVGNGGTIVAEGAENINYKTTQTTPTAGFTPVNPFQTIFYPTDGSAVDFIAYYPYREFTGWTYSVNVGTQASQTGIDLMWSGVANNGGSGYTNIYAGNVTLPFTHQLVKLILTVTPTGTVTDLTGLVVTIQGMNTSADFDVKAGGLSNEGSPAPITLVKDGASYTYEAILLPVTTLGTEHKIVFEIGTYTYTWDLSSVGSLVGGNKYEYTVELSDKINVRGTITDWTTPAKGSGEVK